MEELTIIGISRVSGGQRLSNRGITKTNVISVSKVINAPLSFVYDWCTDDSPDDTKLTRSSARRIILNKTPRQAIYLETFQRNGKSMCAVNIVSLRRPTRWHLDYIGQDADEIGEYRLTKQGHKKTKLDMRFKVKYKIHGAPTRSEDTKQTSIVWDKYVSALEKEFLARNRRRSH